MAVKAKKKKKVKIVVPYEEIGDKLNTKQELFCQYFTRSNSMYGNYTMAYAEAYGFRLEYLSDVPVTKEVIDKKTGLLTIEHIDDSPYRKAYDYCSKAGSRLGRNGKINDRIKEILVSLMTDEEFDSELVHTMRQREDLSAKMQAIKEFNRLKSRVRDNPFIVVPVDSNIEKKGDDALTKYLNGLTKQR